MRSCCWTSPFPHWRHRESLRVCLWPFKKVTVWVPVLQLIWWLKRLSGVCVCTGECWYTAVALLFFTVIVRQQPYFLKFFSMQFNCTFQVLYRKCLLNNEALDFLMESESEGSGWDGWRTYAHQCHTIYKSSRVSCMVRFGNKSM